jgi:hypothetical protein
MYCRSRFAAAEIFKQNYRFIYLWDFLKNTDPANINRSMLGKIGENAERRLFSNYELRVTNYELKQPPGFQPVIRHSCFVINFRGVI